MCTKVLVVLGGDLDEELVPHYRRAEQKGRFRLLAMRAVRSRDFPLRGCRER